MQLHNANAREINLTFDDNDLFFGHYIEVRLHTSGSGISAEIIG